jgi:hypothetical protein
MGWLNLLLIINLNFLKGNNISRKFKGLIASLPNVRLARQTHKQLTLPYQTTLHP